MAPPVSIVINTLDRAASLERTLAGLRQLRYSNFEVIVVQGPCSDATGDVLAGHAAAIRIGHCAEANLSMSRNIGIAMARGEIVAFIDDDALPEPDWLDHLVAGLADQAVGAVGGFIRDPGGVAFQYQVVIADRFGRATHKPPGGQPETPDQYLSPTGTNIAIRRAALLMVGGFDEEYAYFLDETDLNLRLIESGWRLALVPEAEVHHKFAQNQVRGADRIPQSLYVIARSKAYFCWVNAASAHSPADIESHLATFRERRTAGVRSLRKKAKIDRATCERLAGEIVQGLADGARDARSQAARALLTDSLAGQYEAEQFKRYPTPRPVGERMRLCFLCRTGDGAIARWARALAARGHEVTLIRGVPGRDPSVEFADGVWVHAIPDRRDRLEYSAAVAHEVARIMPRRAFQLVCAPLMDTDAAGVIERTGLPIVLSTHAVGPTPRRFTLWPNRTARRHVAAAKLRAAAALIVEDATPLDAVEARLRALSIA